MLQRLVLQKPSAGQDKRFGCLASWFLCYAGVGLSKTVPIPNVYSLYEL